MAFYDYREPIEQVVDKYFEKKRFYSANSGGSDIQLGNGAYPDDSLPETPCLIIRNEEGLATKFIYGDTKSLESEEEASPQIWMEELIRVDGTVTKIIMTYPDGESVTTELVRGSDKKVIEYKYSEVQEGAD